MLASLAVLQQAIAVLRAPIAAAAELLIGALQTDHTIFSCGNGGSAADAQHFSAELLGSYLRPRAALRAMALTTDTSSLTSIANDQAYDQVFSRQLQGLGRAGDVLLAISTSGNSPSVVEVVNTAHQLDMHCVLLSGREGGELATMIRPGDIEIRVPAHATARIQEVHGLVIHCLCDLIDRTFAEEQET
ncbi:MAG TPA: SIS domain-containing protein [Gammaproteobacteria bacterium]|nr:SIS domain-containing protein [Gammaproteobacteria bacterium]